MFALKVMVKLEILDLGRVEVPSPPHLAVCHELDQLYWMSFYPGDALVSFPEHLVLRVYVPPPRPLLPLLRIPSLLPPGLAGLERVLKMTSLLQERGQGGLPDSELARRALHQTPHRILFLT